jgi:hypothetical protein
MSRFLLWFFIILSCKGLAAQDCIWANFTGSAKLDNNFSAQSTVNGYIMPVHFKDSFYSFGQWNKTHPVLGSTYINFITKNGNLYKQVKLKNDSFIINNWITDLARGKMSSHFTDIISGTIINGKPFNPNNEKYLFETDTNGLSIPILKITAKTLNNAVTKPNLVVRCHRILADASYISMTLSGKNRTYYFNDTEDSISVQNSTISLIVKIDTVSKIIKYWDNGIDINSINEIRPSSFLLTASIFGYDSVNINGSSYYNKENRNNLILRTDSVFNILKVLSVPGQILHNNRPISVVDENTFYLTTTIAKPKSTEEVYINGSKLNLKDKNNTVLLFYSNDRVKYFKYFAKTNSDIYSSAISELSPFSNGPVCVLSGNIANPLLILPDSITVNSYVNDGNFFSMKIDTFGNVLWHLSFGKYRSTESSINAILDSTGVVISGTFDSTTTLGNYTLTSNGGTDALLFKIIDNSIYRGNIKKGPYCAGDSIEVPYRAYGKYADTNTFFAELSDENGNFYGMPRQLGSLRTNALQGTIRGVLPLFDVVSSGKYRIRIRSNSPFVQSFMRYDSLYLLIYSKDKANPGADTTICVGDNLQLKTTGGTRWLWSPGTAVRDSTARITQFIGTQNTRMRIAISDSSGCGAPDTAWKYIAIYPKLAVTVRDTVVCRSTQFYMTAKLDGGRPSSRSIYWYSGTTFLGKDTLKSSTWLDTSYMAVARDGCPLNTDTSWVQVTLPNPPVISINDTTVCKGELLTWKSSIVGFKGMPVQLTWYRGNTKLSDSVLVLKVDSNEVLWLHGDDYCAAAENRKELQVRVFDKPIVTGAVDSFCAKAGHTLAFTTLQGKEPFTYWLNNQQVSNPAYAPAKPLQWLQWYAQDACGQKTELDSVLVNQKPVGSIIAAPEKGCAPLQVTFRSNIAGATWYLENSIIQGQDSVLYAYTSAGKYTAILVINNGGCTDSASKQIEVYEAPTAAFEIQQHDLLIGEARTRVLNTSGLAKRYIWYWKDSIRESSSLDVWVLDLQDTGMSKVWMIAESIHGCRDTFIDSVQVHPRPILWIPTAITLNGDGLNDALAAGGIGLKSYRFMVFNRWGEMVFSGKVNEEWRPNSGILPGMYVYRCIYSNWKGTKFEQNGTVMVLR